MTVRLAARTTSTPGLVFRLRAARILFAAVAIAVTLMAAGPLPPTPVGAEGPAASLSHLDRASRAQTVDVPSTFVGFVAPGSDGLIPARVRATAADGTVCGTGRVDVLSTGLGFFRVDVLGRATRTGCPAYGEPVAFLLLYGSVDEGTSATTSAETLHQPGATTFVYLAPLPFSDEAGWSGAPPRPGRGALLTWDGPDGTPIEDALTLLGADVQQAWHLAPSGEYATYVPGGPSFLQSYRTVDRGDLVWVRARR